MKARLAAFGVIEIEGRRYEHDVVIDRGKVSKRHKGPSKAYRDRYGHTPLSLDEGIPWRGTVLVIGTGADGALPVMPEVTLDAQRRGIELITLPTDAACRLLASFDRHDVNAVVHVTC